MKKKSVICHILRPDLFRDFSLAVELSDGLILIDHCTDASALKSKISVKHPAYVVIYGETKDELFSIADSIKGTYIPVIGITAMPEDALSFEEQAYKAGVYSAYFVTDANKHDFREMAENLSQMKAVFDAVPYEVRKEKPKEVQKTAPEEPVCVPEIEVIEPAPKNELAALYPSEIIEANFTVRYEKPKVRKKERTEEEEKKQRKVNDELQAKLRKKYNISDEYTFIIEKKSALEYVGSFFTGTVRLIITIILIALCAYGLICLIYPTPRTEGTKIIFEIYEQIRQLIGI